MEKCRQRRWDSKGFTVKSYFNFSSFGWRLVAYHGMWMVPVPLKKHGVVGYQREIKHQKLACQLLEKEYSQLWFVLRVVRRKLTHIYF